MAGRETVIAAGFGFSSRATQGDLAALLHQALAQAGIDHIDCIAIRAEMPPEPAEALAAALTRPLLRLPASRLAAAADLCQTRSAVSLYHTGLPSVAEAAALAAAGEDATLLLPRIGSGFVTCALARGGS